MRIDELVNKDFAIFDVDNCYFVSCFIGEKNEPDAGRAEEKR